jgi:anaerobic glycerol-3-phosphate dehydrogenase
MQPETSYNPEEPPNPSDWLQLPERERIRVVATFHMVHRFKSSSTKAHAALHTIVENQAATGFGPTVRALSRLQSQGLTRHEALHAIGSVVSGFMFAAMNGAPQTDSHALQSSINARIEALEAESWRKEYGT